MNPPTTGNEAASQFARMYLEATPGAAIPDSLQPNATQVPENFRDAVNMVEEKQKPEVLSNWNSDLEERVEYAQSKSKEYLQRLGTEVVATGQETESARAAARSAEANAQQAVVSLEAKRKESAGVTSSKASAQALEATVKGYTPGVSDLPSFYVQLERQATSLNVPGVSSVIEKLKQQNLSPEKIAPVLARIVSVHEEQETQAKEELEKAKTRKEETELEKDETATRLTIRENVSNFAMEARNRFQEASLELATASSEQVLAQADFTLSRRVATDLGIPEHAAENLVADLETLVGVNANSPVEEANALSELESALISGFATSRDQAGLGGLANAIRTQAGGALAESLGMLKQEGSTLALNRAQVEAALKAKFGDETTVESYLADVRNAVEDLNVKSEALRLANEALDDALENFEEVALEADGAFRAIAEGREIASMEYKSQVDRENAIRAAEEARILEGSTGWDLAHAENLVRDSDPDYARRAAAADRAENARLQSEANFNAMPAGIRKSATKMFRNIGKALGLLG
ncbi:hypothetical protein HYV12_00730 [Candidatus Dojkabacteria bacterium]|nr:hypothetical protein [Candidatus Dojkabacteria bacterium]